jgi:hypothetical protein
MISELWPQNGPALGRCTLPELLEKVIGHMSSNKGGRLAQPVWRTASFCASGECVEVAERDGMIILRDSTRPAGHVLHYGAEEWRSFVRHIKADELNVRRSLSGLLPDVPGSNSHFLIIEDGNRVAQSNDRATRFCRALTFMCFCPVRTNSAAGRRSGFIRSIPGIVRVS